MSDRVPRVQPTSDRPNLRAGRVVEIVFPKGNPTPSEARQLAERLTPATGRAHYENLTPDEAHQLARQLDVYLMELRRATIERSLP